MRDRVKSFEQNFKLLRKMAGEMRKIARRIPYNNTNSFSRKVSIMSITMSFIRWNIDNSYLSEWIQHINI